MGADTSGYLGRMLPHDDDVEDRSKGAKLDLAFNRTVSLWYEAFKQPYQIPGAMYRGSGPAQTPLLLHHAPRLVHAVFTASHSLEVEVSTKVARNARWLCGIKSVVSHRLG